MFRFVSGMCTWAFGLGLFANEFYSKYKTMSWESTEAIALAASSNFLVWLKIGVPWILSIELNHCRNVWLFLSRWWTWDNVWFSTTYVMILRLNSSFSALKMKNVTSRLCFSKTCHNIMTTFLSIFIILLLQNHDAFYLTGNNWCKWIQSFQVPWCDFYFSWYNRGHP